jgi:hypothetical protein
MGNRRLSLKVAEWDLLGKPPQEGFNWSKSRSNWCKDLPSQIKFIGTLPESLSRIDVRKISESTESTVIEKFVASMIWGYGDLGYGSYRVKKMFSTPGFHEKISESFELSSTGRVLEAYEFLSKNRIQQLGPAFGTKWISFSSPANKPAPIYDSFIALWITKYAKKEFGEVSTSSEVWNKRTYATYFEWMISNSLEFGVRPDDLELVIFQDATLEFSMKSKWSNL